MSSEVKIKSYAFYEAVSLLNQVNASLNCSINKINKEGNKLANTWNSKSGSNFNLKNKKLISNMKLLSNGIGDLAAELNKANSGYQQMDNFIASKIGF
ncbi:MAG: hypothetical protein GX258_03075 [Clostridiales bacterium]|nr:hypothetical protein [Clostridiales bacterium]